MKLFKQSFVFSILVGGMLLCSTAQSAMVAANFSWVGDGGYQADGSFVYDNSLALIEAEGWAGSLNNFNHGLNYLEISFYDPAHNFLYRAVDVRSGVVSYALLAFSFNPSTMSFEGLFDIGEDTGVDGEYYIWGDIDGQDSHFEAVNGVILDSQARPNISVMPTLVSEPGIIPMLMAGLVCLLGFIKRNRSYGMQCA